MLFHQSALMLLSSVGFLFVLFECVLDVFSSAPSFLRCFLLLALFLPDVASVTDLGELFFVGVVLTIAFLSGSAVFLGSLLSCFFLETFLEAVPVFKLLDA